jgi:DNA-binding transcriptional regulator YiaG
MQVTSASALLRLRERLDITREDIVRRSHVSVATVRNAEKGAKITRRSALQILYAVNSHLRESNLPEVTLDDLSFVLE